ncbi:MAG: hypothetical protein JSR15_09035 [Proteobacteria bacterium]|nr:hypothetical protein [Pseudomonadota bacterium]
MSGGVAGLCAADSSTVMTVSATVSPVARVEAPPPAPLQISAADLARGYVDVPHALRLRVYSNSRAGFVLDVAARSPWFSAVAIEGLDTHVTLGADGGTIVQRWQGATTREVSLHVRFRLADGLLPGLYAWPLQFRARPL